jgi:hypothetical protein
MVSGVQVLHRSSMALAALVLHHSSKALGVQVPHHSPPGPSHCYCPQRQFSGPSHRPILTSPERSLRASLTLSLRGTPLPRRYCISLDTNVKRPANRTHIFHRKPFWSRSVGTRLGQNSYRHEYGKSRECVSQEYSSTKTRRPIVVRERQAGGL